MNEDRPPPLPLRLYRPRLGDSAPWVILMVLLGLLLAVVSVYLLPGTPRAN